MERAITYIITGITIFMYAVLGLSYVLDGYGLTPYICVPVILLALVGCIKINQVIAKQDQEALTHRG